MQVDWAGGWAVLSVLSLSSSQSLSPFDLAWEPLGEEKGWRPRAARALKHKQQQQGPSKRGVALHRAHARPTRRFLSVSPGRETDQDGDDNVNTTAATTTIGGP